MRTDLSWFIIFFDAAMKLALESSHFYSTLLRCQQRCQPVPCRTWGMTRPGVLSFVAMVLTVVKMTWVSCWHFCLVVHMWANMPHLLVNWFPQLCLLGKSPCSSLLVTRIDKPTGRAYLHPKYCMSSFSTAIPPFSSIFHPRKLGCFHAFSSLPFAKIGLV